MPDRSPHLGINLDEATKPAYALTAVDIEAIARRCEDRAKDGIAFGPSSVPLVVEALKALARERVRDAERR